MKKIGLTGGIGTGKSTVAWIFEEMGVPIISADKIAHEVIAPHSKPWKTLFDRYGTKIVLQDQIINRNELAKIIFSDNKERKFVESVIHPRVQEEIQKQLAHFEKESAQIVVLEIPLLFEVKLEGEVDKVIVVRCDYEQQIARCEKKFGITREETIARIKSQKPIEEKLAKADYIIDNSGSKSETALQTRRIFHELEKNR